MASKIRRNWTPEELEILRNARVDRSEGPGMFDGYRFPREVAAASADEARARAYREALHEKADRALEEGRARAERNTLTPIPEDARESILNSLNRNFNFEWKPGLDLNSMRHGPNAERVAERAEGRHRPRLNLNTEEGKEAWFKQKARLNSDQANRRIENINNKLDRINKRQEERGFSGQSKREERLMRKAEMFQELLNRMGTQ